MMTLGQTAQLRWGWLNYVADLAVKQLGFPCPAGLESESQDARKVKEVAASRSSSSEAVDCRSEPVRRWLSVLKRQSCSISHRLFAFCRGPGISPAVALAAWNY
jgi:hypothetical protein